MAAPTPASSRTVPVHPKWDQGFPIKIVFAANPAVAFYEISVKPPGIDGGDKIETSTQFNTAVHTARARALKMITDGGGKVGYALHALKDCLALVNVETTITILFPPRTGDVTGDSYCFYGYLKSFVPGDAAEGARPEADVAFVATNWDPVNNVEASPVFTPASGT